MSKQSFEPAPIGSHFSKDVMQTLWFAYAKYRTAFIAFLLIGFLGRLLLLGNANVIGIWVDTFCVNKVDFQCRPVPQMFTGFSQNDFLLLLGAFTLIGFVLTLVFRVGFSIISARAVSQIYDETTYRVSRTPMSFFDKTPTGRIVTRFSSDYGNVFRLFGGPLAEFLSIIFDLVGMLLLVTMAGPVYLPAIVIISGLNYLIYRRNRDHLRSSRRQLSASRSPSIAHFSESVQGASTIRSFNKHNTFATRFEKLDQFFLSHKKAVVRKVTSFSVQINSLTAVLALVTGITAYFLAHKGVVSIGSLGVAFGFILLSGNSVQMFFEWLVQFEEAMIGVERMDKYLRMPIEPGARLPAEAHFPTGHWTFSSSEDKDLQNFTVSQKAVEVKVEQLKFGYDPGQVILDDLTFTIKPGERFGIVGRTGSGKSSLIQALFYFYPFTHGQIVIDNQFPNLGNNPQGIPLEQYRKLIGFIAQDPILFKGNLWDNLDIFRAKDPSYLISTLQRVGLDYWAHEQGLQLEIEEKGKNLSVGEKQLICMARCLIQNTPLVIMDEATSSIDPKSEELLVKATEELFAGKTQIIIAHRLSTLKKCDRILWLHQGRIEKIGTPMEILPLFEKSNLSLS